MNAKNHMLPEPFLIENVEWETGGGDIYSWTLTRKAGGDFQFTPGQFNMLYMHGVGEVAISISSDSENGSLIHTTRAVGSVTHAMTSLKAGDIIGLRGPFGSKWPLTESQGKDIVIVCGGMGLPPLRPVIYHILKHRQNFGRVYLLYGARDPENIVYKAELEKWHHERSIDVLVTVDEKQGQWDGHVGVVPQLLSQVNVDPKNTVAMMCGPEIMMHYSQLSLSKMGVSNENIYVSMERNMKCALGHCGHCQWGPHFICKDGPVYSFHTVKNLFHLQEF